MMKKVTLIFIGLAFSACTVPQEVLVLCFDEFYVSDIGDAMLLGGLMQKLFDRGICLVATSNIAPKGVYENGLQRARFIPAIKAVEANTRVLNVDSGIDYRLRVLSQSELYFVGTHVSMSEDASEILQTLFSGLSGGKRPAPSGRVVNRRTLQTLCVS